MFLLGDGVFDAFEAVLGLQVLLALGLARNVPVEIGRCVHILGVAVEAAATDLAHQSGEESCQLLDNEENHEDADSGRVKHRVHLAESLIVHTSHNRNSN